MRKKIQKGMFDAFHVLKKIADNLKKPVKKYGNCPSLYDLSSEPSMHKHMYFTCVDTKIQCV